jgi:integrase
LNPADPHNVEKEAYIGQHTLGHIDCSACEKARSLTLSCISADLPFSVASALWLESRSFRAAPGAISARYIRKSTEKSYRQYVNSLCLFFGQLRLNKIHLGHMREYQEARVTGAPPFVRRRRPNKNVEPGPCPASPKKANQELSILKMILRRAQCWTEEMDEFYERFDEDESELPRALTAEQQRLWLDVSLFKPRWHIVHWYSMLAFETSMSTNEIRALRIGDVNLYHGILSVPPAGGKNKYRVRTIPLYSADVKWAAEQLLARARDLGGVDPQHFLFPWRRPPADFDPTKPMTVSGIKKLWEEVQNASGFNGKKGPRFRAYDTRHTAITRWAEGGMHIAEIMAMAGHMTRRQTEHYTHITHAVKMKALAALPRIGPMRAMHPFYVPNLTGTR